MATRWVLHTETKGTGAQLIPLEREKERKRLRAVEPIFSRRPARRAPEADAPGPRTPRRFRVVDLMTRQVLVDGADAHAAIDVLGQVRSIVDVNVYVWQKDDARWRLLTLDEKRAMWELARIEGAAR